MYLLFHLIEYNYMLPFLNKTKILMLKIFIFLYYLIAALISYKTVTGNFDLYILNSYDLGRIFGTLGFSGIILHKR